MTIRFGAFIAVSCLLHAGLLWYPRHTATPDLNIGGEAQALRVTLSAAKTTPAPVTELAAVEPSSAPVAAPATPRKAPAQAGGPRKTAPRRAAQQPAAETARQTPARANVAASSVQYRHVTPAAGARARPTTSSLSVSDRVSAALQNQLAEAFVYPWLARKRGWQGLVTLSLHVAEDGVLSRWKVVSTSGYSLLDRSALQAAQRIGRLQQAEQLLNGESLNLSIPVRYRLLDG
jgi:protein TonB